MRMTVAVALICLSTSGLTAAPTAEAAIRRPTNIQAQPLDSALQLLAKDRGLQMIYSYELVGGRKIADVSGDLTFEEAMTQILSGTGLTYRYLDDKTVTITPTPSSPPSVSAVEQSEPPKAMTEASGADGAKGVKRDTSNSFRLAQEAQGSAASTTSVEKDPQSDSAAQMKPIQLEEVTVTGTHIRGEIPAGSSLKVYTHQDLEESGAGTVDQFARQMTENFSGADTVANSNSNIGNSRFNGGGINNGFQGASFDLHGLGPSATLTLLNGHRLAAGGFDGSLVDISQIPLSAIDHIEVLADGASAVYGADAVAGVVNTVTRKDFEGAETQLRYANSTDGGASEYTGSQLFGTSWHSGNVLVNYEYDRQNGLDGSERDYIPSQGGADLLIPRNLRNSVLLSASQSVADQTNLSLDGMYSDRAYHTHNYSNSTLGFSNHNASGTSRMSGVTGAVDQGLWSDWHASLTVSYSKSWQQDNSVNNAVIFGFTQDANIVSAISSNVIDADLLATGSLFSLPAGAIKTAIGASYRHEKFDSSTFDDINAAVTTYGIPTLRRHVDSVYGEVAIPLISSANALSWTQRLELSVAARYDDYSDFGSTTNPKVGLLWEPVSGLSLRGTWGKSFRAPQLYQLGSLQQFFADPVANPNSPTGLADLLILNGGNLNLSPERATSYTAGFDLKFAALPNFDLSGTYFHTTFRDRIATPPAAGGNYFGDPAVASFLTLNPPPGLVESYFNSPGFVGDLFGGGPAAVNGIFDNRLSNIATSRQSGVDLTAAYSMPTDYGRFGVSTSVTRLIDYTFQALLKDPAIALVDTFGEPLKWKGRGSLRWSNWGLTGMLSVNYANAYENTLFTPAVPISSWVTEDLFLGYDFGQAPSSYALRGLRLDLTIQNLTNREPPYATLPSLNLLPGQNPVPYDSANASPIGRLISVQLTKRW